MTEEQIQKIIKLLANDNPALRQLALEQLIPFIDSELAIQTIIQVLKDNDTDVRSYAAEILGEVEYSKASIALSQALEDSDWEVRQAAITSFGKHEPP